MLDGDLVADALGRHMRALRTPGATFSETKTTAKELLESLTRHVSEQQSRSRHWPQTPEGLRHRLMKLAPALRRVGVVVERLPRQGNRRSIFIRDSSQPEKVGGEPSRPSRPSITPMKPGFRCDGSPVDGDGRGDGSSQVES